MLTVQNYSRKSELQRGITSHQSEWPSSKSLQKINAGEGVEKGNPPTLLRGCELMRPLWRTVCSFLKKLKIELPYDPAIPLLGIYSEKSHNSKIRRHPNVHCSTIYNSQDWKQPKCTSTGMNKQDVIHIQWNLSHKKKNDIMPFIATWMDLETIILSEVNQTKKSIP